MFGGLCIISGVLQLAYFPVFLSDFPLFLTVSGFLFLGLRKNKPT